MIPTSRAANPHHSHDANNANTRNTRKRVGFAKRSITLLIAFVVVGVLATGFLVISGRASGLTFRWPSAFANIFAGPEKQRLSPLVDLAGDYRSATSGNWNAIATWEIFNGSIWIPAIASPTNTDGVITIRNGHTVTISASGLSYDQVVVDAGGQVTVAATITHTLVPGPGTDLTINGTWLNSGGTWTITAGATWAVGAGGTYVHNTTSSAATPLNAATFDPVSTMIYRGSSTLTPAVSLAGRTFGNLSFENTSGGWSVTPTGATALVVNGNFTLGTGVTITNQLTGSNTFAGNYTINGTLTNSTGTQVYTFTGSGKSISGTGAIAFETFNVSGGASITTNSSASLTATFAGTIDGTLTVSAAFTNNGAMTVSSGGMLVVNSGYGTPGTTNINGECRMVSGTVSNNNLIYGANGTLSFNAASSFNVLPGAQYWPNPNPPKNITVMGAGITLNVPMASISNTLTLTTGAVTNANNLTLGNGANISRDTGSLTGTPTFGSTVNVSYTGTTAVTAGSEIPTTASVLNNLTINKSGGVTLASSPTVNGTLTFTSGDITTGANTLTANNAVTRVSGMVIGNLQRRFTGSGTLTFDVGTTSNYSPVTINGTTGTFPALFTVSATGTSMPGISGANKLNRYWTLTNSPPGVATANLTFTYLSGDVTGTPANYQFIKKTGGALSILAPTGTPTATSATINGVSSFSDWTLAEPSAVTSGSLQFSAGTYSAGESDGTVNITATRTGGSDGNVSVDYATVAGGTASGGGTCTGSTDYLNASGTLTWPAGDATVKSFTITICPDSTDEADETVNLQVSNAQGGAALGSPSAATLTITDDDVCLSTITVNDTGDAPDAAIGDGVCATAGAVCTLRAAIAEANTVGACVSSVSINITVTGTITLGSALPDITRDMVIDGPGAASLTISGNNATIIGTASHPSPESVTISDVTMTNGRSTNASLAGGFSNNSTGTLNLTNVVMSNNAQVATSGVGGALAQAQAGTLNITDSTISNNTAVAAGARGAGVYGGSGNINVLRSTFSDNAADVGGAVVVASGGVTTFVNSTFSGNTAASANAVLLASGGNPTFTNCTITNNSGGGAAIQRTSGTVTFKNSIVAQNGSELSGGSFVSLGYNLIGNNTNEETTFPAGTPNANNDYVGTGASPLNARLGPLASNGGPTQTHALLDGSLATDHGSSGLSTDQRGQTRPYDNPFIVASSGGDNSDIGAYEAQTNLAAAETDVAVSGGNLVITDTNGGTTADTLTISRNGANVRINDPNNILTAGAGATQIDPNTVEVPLASITGNIQVNTLGGNDLLTLNFATGNFMPPGGLSYNGGGQTSVPGDKLAIAGGSQGTVTYNYTNANDGNIVMSAYGTVAYIGLEPISNSGTAADVIFNLPAGPNAATLADDGTGGNGMSRLSGATFETTDFSNPTGSVTINRGNAADTLAVNALPDFTAALAMGTTANPFSTITFNGAITLAANKNLSGEASSTISLSGATSNLITSGTGTISLKTARNVSLIAGSSLETVDGGITVEANQQAGPTAGNFTGLDIASGALVRTTGTGNIDLKGKGGADGATGSHRGIRSSGTITSTSGAGGAGAVSLNGVGGTGISGNNGVEMAAATVSSVNGNVSLTGQGGAATASGNFGVTVIGTGAVIQSTGTATVTLNGTGGAGTLGNSGVNVDTNASVTSASGDIQITGQGTGTSASNLGVIVGNGAAVSSTGAAKVTISGTGGSGGTTALAGVNIQGVNGANHARVTSTGGDISITGVSGNGSGSSNIGVIVNSGGAVTATGAAKITIDGTGGSGTLLNPGVYVDSFGVAGTTISAVNGDVTITGVATDTTGTNQDGVVFQDSSAAVAVAVTTTGTGTITINGTAGNNDPTSAGIHLVDDTSITSTGASNSFVADTMDIGASAVTVNGGANTIALRQKTNGIAIDLGGADSATQLGLTDAELDRFTAGTLNIGTGASGAITVSAAITRAAATVLSLVSGANIDISGSGSLNSAGGNVTLNPNTNVFPSHSGVDVTTGAAATLALTSGKDLKIDIDGTTVDTGYTQLNVAGLVNLASANLSFAGSSYTPVGGESFTVVNNDGADAITGTFANGPTFTNFLGSGLTATISYTAGDGNDAVLTVAAVCVPPAIVYVDDSWVGTTPGTDPDMGGPATNFGCDSFATIQGGVNGVATSGTVNVAAGNYVENVTIPKALTLTGAGALTVTLRPALSAPNTCMGSSLCPGGSNLILVQADNVTISGMTLDGNNPSLTSGVLSGGVDVDARNGIITNHPLGTFNNLEVHHTIVNNIYLRGVYQSSGGSFNFHDNVVDNVQGEAASIGMFSFSGAGAYTNNTVSHCNDAISANHSRGISFTGNTVMTSASGIHSDNAGDSGGTPDTISNNTVTNSVVNGYGIWVFVPYKTVTVQNNTVTNTDVGYAVFGDSGVTTTTKPEERKADEGFVADRPVPRSANVAEPDAWLIPRGFNLGVKDIDKYFGGVPNPNAPIPSAPPVAPFSASFKGNTVDGQNKANSTGVYFTTDQLGFGNGNPKVEFTSNTVVNNTDGFFLQTASGFTLETAASFNRIVNNTTSAVTTSNLGTLNGSMENNWWGCNAGPNNLGCGNIVGPGVDFDPWLVLGISASPATIPPGGSTTVTADMTHNSNGAVPSVTEFVPPVAVSFGAVNGTVFPTSGTITNGQATTTFTSNSTSSGSASATVDNQTVSTPINVSAANTYTWSPFLGSTNYTLPTNWTPNRILPQTNDNLVINGTTTPAPTITNVPTQTIAGLHLINGPLVTLQAGGTSTLTINGATGSDLTVPALASLTISGSNDLTIKVSGAGSAGTIGGVFIELAGAHRLFGDAGGVITFQNNSLATTGTGLTSNPFGTGGAGDGDMGSVIFASGSTYSHNGGQSPFGTAGNGPVAQFQTGSLARWFTNTGFQASGRTYADLEIGDGTNAVNVSDSGTGNFQFDNLTIKSTSSTSSSLAYNGSGGATITIRGNVSSTGTGSGSLPDLTLTPGSGGTHINKIAPGTLTFSTTGNSRAIDLETGATVENGTTLALSRVVLLGLSNPHLNTLTVNSTASITGSSSGYVIGGLKKVAVPATFVFPVGTVNGYSPLDLANASGGGDLTVAARTPQQPVLAAGTSLQRYWTLTEGGTVTADLTFHYLDPTDVAGNEANYRVVVVEGGNATSFPADANHSVDTTGNTFTALGVQNFSDWTAAEPAAPTAVKLNGFSALRSGDEVKLEWQSGYEARNLGYNIYREQDGKRVAITPSLVAGSALVAGNATRLTAGLGYVWYDHLSNQQSANSNQQSGVSGRRSAVDGPPPVTYWLEDVDLNGTRTLHGPIAIAECGMGNADCQKLSERSRLLRELTNPQSAVSNQQSNGVQLSSWPAAVTTAEVPTTGPDPTEMQRTIAGMDGLKISVSRPGWYRLTQPQVLAAGLNIADANGLQLYRDGRQIPFRLSNSTEQFGPTDYLEFYGEGLDSTTAAAQVYYLVKLAEPGKGIEVKEKNVGPGDRVSPQGFAYTVERKERMIYFSSLLNGETENFFGQVVTSAAVSSTIPISHLDPSVQTAGTPAQLEVVLQGVSNQSHLVQVRFNGTSLGTINFANTEHPSQTLSVPASAMHDGNNVVELTSLGGAADVSLVDVLRLTYVRSYTADNNALQFNLESRQTKRLTGFTSDHIRVVDVTDPNEPLELTPDVVPDGAGFAALIGVDKEVRAPFSRPHKLLAFADGQADPVDALALNTPSSLLSETAGADYVMITTAALKSSIEPLAQLRQGQGMVVKVVDVEDLYDEFTFGEHSPRAIHDYLATAQSNWTRKPHYLLLAGDATYDPKNYSGQGMNDLVPTKLIDTTLRETASDDWLADFNSDGMADISVGRLPTRTAGETTAMVSKIVGYENAAPDPSRGALLVADTSFEAPSSAIQSLLPSGMTVATINRSSADDATIHNQIIAGLNQGPLVANYIGHGSNGVWTGASLLSTSDAPTLTNTNRLSVFTMMTCFNGFFQDAYNESLSEGLLKAPGGAVAVWASTTLTEPAGQQLIDQEFYRQLFGAQPATLGDAARAAKVMTNDADVRRTWTLFGDPALRLR